MAPIQPKIIDLDFVFIELFPSYLVATIKEGVLFDTPQLATFYEIFDTYYPDKKFGYISNRIHDYTVNPTCYLKSTKFPRLIGMAICCKEQSTYNTAKFEKSFYKRPFRVFYKMEDCIDWIDQQIVANNTPLSELQST